MTMNKIRAECSSKLHLHHTLTSKVGISNTDSKIMLQMLSTGQFSRAFEKHDISACVFS